MPGTAYFGYVPPGDPGFNETAALSGSATISLSPAATLTGVGAISGAATIGLSASAELVDDGASAPSFFPRVQPKLVLGQGVVSVGSEVRGKGTVGRPEPVKLPVSVTGAGEVEVTVEVTGTGVVEYPPLPPVVEWEQLSLCGLLT